LTALVSLSFVRVCAQKVPGTNEWMLGVRYEQRDGGAAVDRREAVVPLLAVDPAGVPLTTQRCASET